MREFDELFFISYMTSAGLGYSRGIDKIFSFPLDREYLVGIDQSTTQTGMAILDTDLRLYAVMDIQNLGLPSYQTYVVKLRRFLCNQLKGMKIKLFIFEDIEDKQKSEHTRRVLTELAGMLGNMPEELDSIPHSAMDCIRAGVWRKHYLKDSRYQGRRKRKEVVKQSAVEESCIRYPSLSDYYAIEGKGTDSADALGIILGYISECFYDKEFKIRRVNSCMKITPNVGRYQQVVMTNEGITNKIESLQPDVFADRKTVGLIYNPTMTVEENCERAVSNYDDICALIAIDDKSREILKWLAGGELGKHIFVITYRNNRRKLKIG